MVSSYNGLPVPANGAGITYASGRYHVPERPIIPYIEGDGTGRDIWKASVRVFDAAVERAYRNKRRVAWYDVYAGIEWEQGTAEAAKLIDFLNKDMLKGGKKQIRLDSGVGIKPISVTGTKRLVRMAIQFALTSRRPVVTLVHKGNIQKFTEGAFRKWGYDLATEE